MGKLIDHAPEIIRAAAQSRLGVLALMVLVVGILGYVFFRRASEAAKASVFVLILVGVGLFAYAAVKEAPALVSGGADGYAAVSVPAESIQQTSYSLQEALGLATQHGLLALGIDFGNDNANGGKIQCQQGATGQRFAVMGNWLPEIVLTPNDDPGGCSIRFAILDPKQLFGGTKINVVMSKRGGGSSPACYPNISPRIPVTQSVPGWSEALHFDTRDSIPDTCALGFRIEAGTPASVQFEAYSYPDGATSSQCGNPAPKGAPHTIWVAAPSGGHALDVYVRTTNSTGSCRMGFRVTRRAG